VILNPRYRGNSDTADLNRECSELARQSALLRYYVLLLLSHPFLRLFRINFKVVADFNEGEGHVGAFVAEIAKIFSFTAQTIFFSGVWCIFDVS